MLRELFNRLIAEANATRHLTSEKQYHIPDQPVDFVEHIRMMYAYRLSEMWLDVEDH